MCIHSQLKVSHYLQNEMIKIPNIIHFDFFLNTCFCSIDLCKKAMISNEWKLIKCSWENSNHECPHWHLFFWQFANKANGADHHPLCVLIQICNLLSQWCVNAVTALTWQKSSNNLEWSLLYRDGYHCYSVSVRL